MADEETLLLSGSTEKKLNKGRRNKIRLSEWKDHKNKCLRNASKSFRNTKDIFVPGKCASGKVTVRRCTYECDKISKDMKTKDIFRSEFKLRFGPPRLGSYSYCDELYIHLAAAETEDEQKIISAKVHFITERLRLLIKFFMRMLAFDLIERRKKKSTVYHQKQWLEDIVNASPAFSAYYMDKEDFIVLSAIEGMLKKQPSFKITSFHWIQFSLEEPNTVRMRVSYNTLQPWHSYVISSLPRGRKHKRQLSTVLPQIYEEAIAIKKAKKKKTCYTCAGSFPFNIVTSTKVYV
ncbi:hypothetical protein PR048_011782 [Dryococelus australis]|uniref:Uncharacterized protein n=1 Tax=Dryococelus australis TaxID=614101 RepID=A0ABQ9HMI0_9NEOP|nr:hypothetical protein PR048_011782 [Dryococelus australis]